MKKIAAAVAVLMTMSAGVVHADNLGFEAGNTSDWNEIYKWGDSGIEVVASWTRPGGTENYAPAEGNFFAVLGTGESNAFSSTLSQTFSLKAGDRLEGWSGFCCGDEVSKPYPGDNGEYNDYGKLSILSGLGSEIASPWYADSYDIGYSVTSAPGIPTGQSVYFGPVQWQHWSWTADAPGSYTLQYTASQTMDGVGASCAFLDGVKKVQASEASTLILFGSVLSALALAAARKKTVPAF